VKRRAFIALLGGAAARPLAARAQQPAMPVIGFLNSASFDTYSHLLGAFRLGLKESSYVEGENVAIEYRWAGNQFDRLPALADELVRRQVAAIVATGGIHSALAAKAATTTIPIVFNIGDDPVRLGLVASLARPGGNVTGINNFFYELVAKRLALLRELVPTAIRVAVLVNPANAQTETTLRDVEAAARPIGLQIQIVKASASREIDAAFATLVRDRADAVFLPPDPLFISRRFQIVQLARKFIALIGGAAASTTFTGGEAPLIARQQFAHIRRIHSGPPLVAVRECANSLKTDEPGYLRDREVGVTEIVCGEIGTETAENFAKAQTFRSQPPRQRPAAYAERLRNRGEPRLAVRQEWRDRIFHTDS